MLLEAGGQLTCLNNGGWLDLHCVSDVFQRDLLGSFDGAGSLQDHVDCSSGKRLWFLALSYLQTRQIVGGDLAGIDDVRGKFESVAGMLGHFGCVKSSLVLGEEKFDLLVALVDITGCAFCKSQDLIDGLVRVSKP